MQTIIYILAFAAGAGIIYAGANLLVSGGIKLARSLGVSSLIVGLTLIACGTSFPEFAVGILSSMKREGTISLGNVIGANLLDITLAIGVTAVILPLRIEINLIKKQMVWMISSMLVLYLFCLKGVLNWYNGLGLLFCMVLYLSYSFYSVRKEKNTEGILKQEVTEKIGLVGPSVKYLFMSAAGILLLLSGGEILLRIALHIIKQFNMAKTFIGLSLISFGTALPEFVTSVVAVLKKEYNISVGNIIGTVIFNTFAVIGVAAVLSPVHVPETLIVFELPVLLFFSCLLFLFFWTKSVLSRIEGAVLIFGYVIFLIILSIRNL